MNITGNSTHLSCPPGQVDNLSESDSLPQCVICLDELGSNLSDIQTLSCDHRFHAQCLDRWLSLNNNCPICRRVQLSNIEPRSRVGSAVRAAAAFCATRGVASLVVGASRVLGARIIEGRDADFSAIDIFQQSFAGSLAIGTPIGLSFDPSDTPVALSLVLVDVFASPFYAMAGREMLGDDAPSLGRAAAEAALGYCIGLQLAVLALACLPLACLPIVPDAAEENPRSSRSSGDIEMGRTREASFVEPRHASSRGGYDLNLMLFCW